MLRHDPFLDRSDQRLHRLKLRTSTTRLVCASTGKRASCSLAMMFLGEIQTDRGNLHVDGSLV
jgi:hypothetical protein